MIAGGFVSVPAGASPSHLRYTTIDVPGATGTDFLSINNFGTKVGFYSDTPGGFAGSPVFQGFVEQGNHFTTIDDPLASAIPDGGTEPFSINDLGLIVGYYTDSFGVDHGFVYRDGHFSTLDDPHAGTGSGDGTLPEGINDEGVITGSYIDKGGVWHGFVYDGHGFTTLNEPGAGTASGQGTVIGSINNVGFIVGTVVKSDGDLLSFVLRDGHLSPVVDPVAPTETGIAWSTDLGTSGGTYLDSNDVFHGFLDLFGSYTTLNDPFAGTGAYEGTGANGGNDAGTVVGYYIDSQGNTNGFELTPGP